ncbi:hypothetical protein [Gluconobacter oxydans]|uniref:Uncharacterized protein n=1 Tax=Gluconobacter oxydans (strain 621H) TaxID=290633 RepID=Q5FRF6_GLUOX|nr:hypothetical protein [Gluconobacter oxydans]AAW61040.1 Hypothetical protein GOX1279 [Gluconobacter oxydans 621H]
MLTSLRKFYFIAAIVLPNVSWASPAIQSYRTETGQYAKTFLTTPLDSANKPLVSTYKGTDGQWHALTVSQQICSLGKDGTPQICDNLTSNLIGQPLGVAALDSNGNLTGNFTGTLNGLSVSDLIGSGSVLAPISSALLTVSPQTVSGEEPLLNAGRFPVVSNVSNAADPFQSPDAFYIGGLPTQGWAADGRAANQTSRPGSLVVAGQPWGPFNAATLESLLMGAGVDAQNGVCATDWRNGAGHICGADGVAQYIGVTNVQAMIVGNVSGFTATSVVLKTPLTANQIAQLRVGMYITTNEVNATTLPTMEHDSWNNLKLPKQNYYVGVISGWSSDGTTITVSGWDIPAASSHPSGQVPGSIPGDALDTWSSNYGYPVVFIGNPNNGSGRNEYLDYKGYNAGDDPTGATQAVGNATATAHSLTGDEMDLRYWATRPNEVHLDGVTVSIASDAGGIGRAGLSQDSYAMALSGDIHNLLILDGPDDGNIIEGHSFYLHGQEGVSTAGSRPIQTLFGFTGEVDGDSSYNLMGWLKKDVSTTNGINGASFHLGIVANGYANTLDPSQNGLGEIVWNHNGTNQGGISLCGGSGACTLDVAYGGILTTSGQVNAQQPIAMLNGKGLQFMPSDNDGYSYWYAPPSVGGLTLSAKTYQGGDASITGYNGTFTGAAQVTGDVTAGGTVLGKGGVSVGNGQSLILFPSTTGDYSYLTGTSATQISAKTSVGGDADISGHMFKENLVTPASSSSACEAGQFTDDANYHYVCISTNTWKRVALSSF